MKRCPSCRRTYEDDSQAFCFTDGARLVEEGQAYDSQRTMVAPPPPQAPPPDPTQYYRPEKQTGPTSPYSTQGETPPSWPPPVGQSGQHGWPAQTPAPPPPQSPVWGTPQPQSPYQQSAPFAPTAAQSASGQRRGLGIAALVLGVLSIQDALFIFFRWVYPFSTIRTVAFLLAFIGLILGAIALTLSTTNPARHAGRGLALAGVVTSFLSLFLILVRGGF
jgi:hypothetical protein